MMDKTAPEPLFPMPDLNPDPARDRVPEGYQPRHGQGPFTRWCGPFYYRRTDEGMVQGLRIAPHHCNRSEVVHGGVLMTLADSVLGRMCAEYWGAPGLTIQMEGQFLGPSRLDDWLEAHATIRHKTGRLLFCDAEVVRGEPGGEASQVRVFLARGIFSRPPRQKSL